MCIEDVGGYLKEKGIKPSYQRMKIFEYLLKNKIHPTVDTIYKALSPKIPTLSKTTVYNTLNLFIENKLVNVIVIEENETRYDIAIDIGMHGHFKCENCGKVYDVEVNPISLGIEGLEKFDINEQHIYFKGTCKECTEKK